MMTASEQLAEAVLTVHWDALPAATRQTTLDLCLDLLGVLIRGGAEPSSGPVRQVAAADRAPNGASGIGIRDRVPTATAALLNGTAAHALELDDVTRASSLHPGVVVIPAALAVAEARGSSGREFLEAVIAGYEVVIRVGNALDPASAYARGFHPTGVAGVIGAATAVGLLLKLDSTGLANTMAIAATMASGSLEYLSDGTWTKRLNAGWAAHAGVLAGELAAAGFRGPRTSLEGPLGLLHAFSDKAIPETLTAGLGSSYAIETVAIKPYACCRYSHGLIDGMLELAAAHRVTPEQVRRVGLGVLSGGALLVAEPIEQKRSPRTLVEAQFSAPFAAAVALVHGAAGVDQFSRSAIDDPVVQALMARTDCFTSPDLDKDYPNRWPAEVRIELADGRTLQTRVEFASGEPENPIPRGALEGKFRALTTGLIDTDAQTSLVREVEELPTSESVEAVAAILRRASPEPAADRVGH